MWACFGAKGGVGTTTIAIGYALAARHLSRPALLVDLVGDVPAVLGVAEPALGVADWLSAGDEVTIDALRRLEVPVGHGLRLLSRGAGPFEAKRVASLLALLAADPGPVVIDAQWGTPSAAAIVAHPSCTVVLVLRPCYVAVSRAQRILSEIGSVSAQVVLVEEPGRALVRHDVEKVLGRPVHRVAHELAVARAIDAGVLASRAPKRFLRAANAAMRSEHSGMGVVSS
ncbi:MAG: Mrp family chromosome partitioning ATPase [Candidatus Poriferisodalaceae bacterium]|jgi:Mrp family chromosome partitioning ATPase